MMHMDPSFIEQAQRRLNLLLRDCRGYMRKYCPQHWVKSCHHVPCEAIAFMQGEENCEQKTNELKYLATLLQGSGTKQKPGKSQYIPRTRGWKSPRARIIKP